MATIVSQVPQQSTSSPAKAKLKSIKELAESPTLTSIPANYTYFPDSTSAVDPQFDHHYSVPVIDFSLLESGSADQRSKIVQDLGKACHDWGFFMVVNHGVPESLMQEMIDKCNEFFNLTVGEKQEFEDKNVKEPIRYGTSFNTSMEDVNFWRDYLKIIVHPQFHSPNKPHGFSEISSAYCKQARRVTRVLLKGICTSLGLDETEIERSMNLKMGLQILTANLYPPCPQPNLAIGMPPHSDHGLLTLLAQNQVGGLQILHGGKWVPVNALPNSLLVNTGDHIEILSNGKYKSVLHRAIVNNRATRISIAVANGPSPDMVVRPAPQLTNGHAKYKPMVYKQYMQLQQSKRLDGKSCLNTIRL